MEVLKILSTLLRTEIKVKNFIIFVIMNYTQTTTGGAIVEWHETSTYNIKNA